jgi:hypothetical protein
VSDYRPTAEDIIATYIFLPFALIEAAFGDKETQQTLLHPFKKPISNIRQLFNYLGSRV